MVSLLVHLDGVTGKCSGFFFVIIGKCLIIKVDSVVLTQGSKYE